ncbi:hypothetical protein RZE82_07785 [Mollicutes bacterium LVI A0039]|nr:hypothetical protein RZE82_07785 [Mollicutes bacterium LVI A0039]
MNHKKKIDPNDRRKVKLSQLLQDEFASNDEIPDRRYRLGFYEKTSFTNSSEVFHNRSKQFIETHIIDRSDPRSQFITVNTFSHKTRKSQYVFNLTNFYIDLDIYNSDYFKSSLNEVYPSKNQYRINHRLIKKLIKSICERENIPYPSKIMYSGNGYYLFWKIAAQNQTDEEGRLFLGAPKQMSALYKAVQRQLVKCFTPLGADSSAIDVSRVLRAEGSTNTKTGEYVETIYETGKHFDIKEFATNILPYSYNEAKQYKEKKALAPHSKKSSFSQSYAEWLKKYLEELIELKLIKKGNTNNFMYLYFYALKLNEISEDEGYQLHSTFKHKLEEYELRNCVRSANMVNYQVSKRYIRDFLRLDETRNRSTKKQVKYARMIYKVYNEQLRHYSSRELASFLNVGKDTANKIKRKYEQINYVFEQFLDKEIKEYKPVFKSTNDSKTFDWIYKYLSLISSLDDYKKWQTEFATL